MPSSRLTIISDAKTYSISPDGSSRSSARPTTPWRLSAPMKAAATVLPGIASIECRQEVAADAGVVGRLRGDDAAIRPLAVFGALLGDAEAPRDGVGQERGDVGARRRQCADESADRRCR